MRQTQADSRCH